MKKIYLLLVSLSISTFIYGQCAFTFTVSQIDMSCFGVCNGSASVSASGGVGSFTYSWFPGGAAGLNVSGLCAGTFKCVVEQSGCKDSVSFPIVEPAQLNISTSPSNVTCPGACNGNIGATASGGTPVHNFSFSPGGVSGNLCANTYKAIVTDANGCKDSSTVVITQPQPLNITLTKTDVTCFGESNGTATVAQVTGGTPSYNYSWHINPLESAPTAVNRPPGLIRVSVTDGIGCKDSASITINEPPKVVITTLSTTSVTCFGGTNGAATMSVSGGVPKQSGYSYSWDPNGYTTKNISNVPSALYTFSVTDSLSCVVTKTVNIAEPPPFIATAIQSNACGSGSNGVVTASVTGGTPSLSYKWAPGGQTTQTVSGLPPGVYSVTVTDSRSCTSQSSVTVALNPAIISSVTVTPVSCGGGNDGAINMSVSGGTPGFRYSWSPNGQTTEDLSALTSGTYTIVITDSATCVKTTTISVTQPAVLALGSSQSNICPGATNGSATVTATGGTPAYTYSWSTIPSQSTGTATGLSNGTYTCLVTDAGSCTAKKTITIVTSLDITLTLTPTHLTCYQNQSGSVSTSATGGTVPYTYYWSPGGASTASISGINSGLYSLTITDAAGCTKSDTATVNQPSGFSIVTSKTDASCTGCTDGSASVIASGGSGNYTYSWSNGVTTNSIGGLGAATYSVCVTDQGCDSCAAIVVDQPIGIKGEMAANNSLYVYPNPFNKQLSVNYTAKTSSTMILAISNILGETISTYSENVLAGQLFTKNISTSFLPDGIYLITIKQDDNTLIRKIVKTAE